MGCCGGKVSTVKEGVEVGCAGGRKVYCTSQAEILARRFSVDLCTVRGTGRGGSLINEQDVKAAAGVNP